MLSSAAAWSAALSRFPMTLWLVPVIPTRFPSARSEAIIRAPL